MKPGQCRQYWVVLGLCAGLVLGAGCRKDPEPASRDPSPSSGEPTGQPAKGTDSETAPAGATAVVPTLPESPPTVSHRSGVLAPKDLDPVTRSASARFSRSGQFYLRVPLDERISWPEDARVTVEGPRHGVAVVSQAGRSIVLRLVGQRAPESLKLTVFSPPSQKPLGQYTRQVVTITKVSLADEAPTLESQFFEAAAKTFRRRTGATGMSAFAAGRMEILAGGPMVQEGRSRPRPNRPATSLAEAMELYSANRSIHEALQADRGLWLRRRPKNDPTVTWDSITPVKNDHFDFGPFVQNVTIAADDLAASVPDDVAFASGRGLSAAVELMQRWMAQYADLATQAELGWTPRTLVARYLDAMMLSPLAEPNQVRQSLDAVVTEWAVLVDDPFVVSGTAAALLLRATDTQVVLRWLATAREAATKDEPSVLEGEWTHRGVVVRRYTGDRSGRTQHVAVDGDLVWIANSRALLRRALDARHGESDLARASDYRWYRMHYPRPERRDEIGLFISDRFVARAVSPQKRIADLRRTEAHAALRAVSHAALLHRWLSGELPKAAVDMVRLGVLSPEELKHADGSEIRYDLEKGVSSRWGRVSELTPLAEIEVSEPTKSEALAYRRFADNYQKYWKGYLDPVGGVLRGGESVTLDVRVAPLIDVSEYREMEERVGRASIRPPTIDNGVQWTSAIGKDAGLRKELASMLPTGWPSLDWIGDWGMAGFLSDGPLFDLALSSKTLPTLPDPESAPNKYDVLGYALKAPAYAGIHVGNPLGLAAALTALRAKIDEVAPGQVVFGPGPIHRAIQTVRVAGNGVAFADGAGVHYAIVEDVFIITPNVAALKRLIDSVLDGVQAKAASPEDGRLPQTYLRVAPGKGALRQVLLGLGHFTLFKRAPAMLHDAAWLPEVSPDSAQRWLGVPGSPAISGSVNGPVHRDYGSLVAPKVPSLDTDGPLARALDAFSFLDAGLRFERLGAGDQAIDGVHAVVTWGAK